MTRFSFYILLFLLINFSGSLNSQNNEAKNAFNKGVSLKTSEPEKAINLFDKSFNLYMQSKDTVNALHALFQKGFVFETTAKYAKSYDALWKAMLLMDNVENDGLKSVVYHRLGRIYSYYKREDKSIKFLKKALDIQKKILSTNNSNKAGLTPYYYSLASTYRELNKPALMKIYLDSSYAIYNKDESIIAKQYLDFEKAIYLFKKNKEEKALEVMEEIYPWFQKTLLLIWSYSTNIGVMFI